MEDGRKVEFNVLQLFERMNFSFFLLEKKSFDCLLSVLLHFSTRNHGQTLARRTKTWAKFSFVPCGTSKAAKQPNLKLKTRPKQI
jgi:hypothetical protein